MSHKALRPSLFATAISLAACTISSAGLYAQTDTAQLSGSVTDSTGAAIAGATVHLHNDATGTDRTATSNSSGSYTFNALPIGTYREDVSFSGFGAFRTTVTLNVGAASTVDARLGATASQDVEVVATDEASSVNLSNQETSTIISPKQVVDLPSLTRNIYDFVALSGNVGSDPGGSTGPNGVGVAINGQRSASTEILLDGIENVDLYSASVGIQVPLDSVSEYRIISNGFDAQYGRASGGIVNVATKTGTNKLHGSLYEYNRVSALAANTYYEDAQNYANRAAGLPNNPQDHFTRNQFGYSVGGPIKRDHLFFFSNTEWNRIRSTGLLQYEVPTAAFLAAASPATQSFFNAYGTTLAPGTTLGATVPVAGVAGPDPLQVANVHANVDAGAGSPVNTWSTSNRFDYSKGDKLSMYFRGAVYNDTYAPGYVSVSPYNGFNTGQTDFNQNYLYNLTYAIRPNLLTSSKVTYARYNQQQPLGPAGVVPSLYLNQANVASTDSATNRQITFPGYLPTSPGGAIPFGGPQNEYQFIEELAWTKGRHTLKAGGGFVQTRDNRAYGAYENAVELVAKSGTKLPVALNQLQQGNAYSFEVAIDPQGKLPCSYNAAGTLVQTPACSITLPAASPSFVRENTFNDGFWYVSDQWKPTPRLTLNAGVRWEYYGVQHNHNPGLESNFFLGTGANLAQQVQTGQVLTTPNSPVGGLQKKNLNNYAPRIGFAFDPKGDGKWSIRGGYGISYERNFGNVTYNVIQNPPNYAGVTLVSNFKPATATAAASGTQYPISTNNFGPFAGTGNPVALAPSSLRALQQNMPTAYTNQFNLTVEHQIAPGDLISIDYSGAHGVHQYAIANLNGVGYGGFVGNPAGSYANDRLNPQYGAINYREANGTTQYNSLNVGFTASNLERFGLNLQVNYTWSHALDDLSSTFSQSGNNFNLGYLNPFNPRLDYGNADYDTRHRVVIGGLYEPKFLEFKGNRFAHAAAGGLEFAPIAVLRTGTPFTIFDCTNGINSCPRIAATPDIQYHGTVGASTGPGTFSYLNIPATAANPFVNSQGYSDFPDAIGGYQNPGIERNQFFGPGNVSFNMGVYKNFHLLENRYNVQIRGEFYDILNHHNLYPASLGAADISQESKVDVIKGSPTGTNSPADERRNVQLAIRFEF